MSLRYFRYEYRDASFLVFQFDKLKRTVLFLIVPLVLCSGCASTNYHYGIKEPSAKPLSSYSKNSVKVSGNYPTLDRYEKFVQHPFQSIGNKLGMSEQVKEPQQEHDESRSKAVRLASEYLEANGLSDVHIDVRRYEPAEQWQRLKKNPEVGPVWKYTGGTMSWLQYKLLPLRIRREDLYDPYTNTLHINSADPVDALIEAAKAKQIRSKRFPGAYAMLQQAPLVPLFHESCVASDVLSYAKSRGDEDLLRRLYPKTYEEIGTSAVSGAMSFVPASANVPFYGSTVAEFIGGKVGEQTGNLVASNDNDSKEKKNYSWRPIERLSKTLSPKEKDMSSGTQLENQSLKK